MCLAQQQSETEKAKGNMIFEIYRTKSNNSKLLEKRKNTDMLKAVERNTHTNRKSTHSHTKRKSFKVSPQSIFCRKWMLIQPTFYDTKTKKRKHIHKTLTLSQTNKQTKHPSFRFQLCPQRAKRKQ